MYTPDVARQVAEVQKQFAEKTVSAEPDGAGGAFVVIDPIDPGPAYRQRTSWLGFHITNMCPDAAIYPVYLSPGLERVDGAAHTAPITPATWRGRPALQYSLRDVQHDPETDTAAIKAAGVIACLAERR